MILLKITTIFFIIIYYSLTKCFAFDVVLSWDKNLETDLAGYKVYYKSGTSQLPFNADGAAQGASPINVSNQNVVTINGLDPGQDYYFAVTAYNYDGIESSFSNTVFVPKSSSIISSQTQFTYEDVLLALQVAIGKVVLTPYDTVRLDVAPVVNGISLPNGKIDAGDAIVILSRILYKTPI